MSTESPTVVIVDTDDSQRLLLSGWLSSLGFRVVTFNDAEVALFVSAAFSVDAVVLGSGFANEARASATSAFIHALHSIDATIPFVLLAGPSEQPARTGLPRTVVTLSRPWCGSRLSTTIQALLNDRSKHRPDLDAATRSRPN